MLRFLPVVLLLMLTSVGLRAQSGEALYPFLNLPLSVSASGVGGNSISSQERDLNLVFHNPAELAPDQHHTMEVGFMNYLSDIKIGSVAYARKIDDRSAWMAGVRYVNYGEMLLTDETDNVMGTTSAGDLALTGSYSRMLSAHWRVGASVHAIYSVMDEFTSMALAADAGLFYHNPAQLFSAGLVLKNVGAEVVAWDQTYERMPWDVQFGLSKKFAHAPFRLTLTVQDLTNLDIPYLKEATSDVNNTTTGDPWVEKVFKHTLFGVEFVPSDNFLLSLGYNYRRKTELALVQRTAFSGFTAGFSLKVKNTRVGASFARYHAAGSSLQLTYSMNLNKIGL